MPDWGDAIWGDTGNDRLSDEGPVIDTPTEHDLQIGTNDSSPIYTLDRATGQFALEEGLGYLSPIPSRAQYEGLMQSFLR